MVFIPKKTAIQFVPIQQSTLFLHEAQHPEGLCPARRLTAGACGVPHPPAPQLGFHVGRGRAAPVSLPPTGLRLSGVRVDAARAAAEGASRGPARTAFYSRLN